MGTANNHNDHKGPSLKTLMAYLRNRLGERERHALEKRLLDDDFARDAMEGFEQIGADALEEDLAGLKRKLGGKKDDAGASRIVWWRWAAAVALVMALGIGLRYTMGLIEQQHNELREQVSLGRDSTQKADVPKVAPPSPEIAQKVPEPIERSQPEKPERATAQGETGMREEPVSSSSQQEKTGSDIPLLKESDRETEIAMHFAEAPSPDDDTDFTAPAALSLEPEREKAVAARAPAEQAQVRAFAPEARKKGAASGGTVSGRVLSTEDGEAIPGVSVRLAGTGSGVISGMNGAFFLAVGAAVTGEITVSYVGYHSRQIPFQSGDTLNILLEPDYTVPGEIVVADYDNLSGIREVTGYTAPEPSGGLAGFNRYLRENTRYPSPLPDPGLRTSVVLKATVSTGGDLLDVEVLRSPGPEFEREALRLLREGPPWAAATENGRPVPGSAIIRIRFVPPE